jgi:CO dehydrogenase maturation factor
MYRKDTFKSLRKQQRGLAMKKISITGKGGTGKSVMTTLLSESLGEKGYSVLVIDSDESNTGLFRMFGFDTAPKPVMDLFGGERKVWEILDRLDGTENADPMVKTLLGEKIIVNDISPEYYLRRDGLRLMSIGKITHPFEGCACPIGKVNSVFLEKLALTDREIVIADMEAGVEHFGRGVERGVDTVIIVIEPSFESLSLATTINDIAREGGITGVRAILNKIPSESIEKSLREQCAERGINIAGSVRYDPVLVEECLRGKALGESQAREDMRKIVARLI